MPVVARRCWHAARLLVLLLGPLGCREQSSGPAPAPHVVRYALDWALDGVVQAAEGGAWEVDTDLGYRVRVTRGYVTSYSMELVECPRPTPTVVARLGIWLWHSLEGVAYAGHATGTPNPAALRAMQVEPLLAPRRREVGSVRLAPQTYCQMHYLVARAAREASGLPSELDMVDTSLHVEGTYRAPGESSDVPFTIHTAAAYGALFDQTSPKGAPLRVDTGVEGPQVTVRRRLARMFDGVDFARMRPPVVANQTLKALIDHAEVEIAARHDDP